MALRNQGKDSEAEAVLRDTLPRMQRVLGPEHEHALRTASALAGALQRSAEVRRGRAVAARHAGDTATRAWGRAPRHPRNVQGLGHAAHQHAQMQRSRGAVTGCTRPGQAHTRSGAPRHPQHSPCAWSSPFQAARQGCGSRGLAHGHPRHPAACTWARPPGHTADGSILARPAARMKHGGTTHRNALMHGAGRSFCCDSPANLAKCSCLRWRGKLTTPVPSSSMP